MLEEGGRATLSYHSVEGMGSYVSDQADSPAAMPDACCPTGRSMALQT